MPRIFKYNDIPNICFTFDKELNILIYRSPYYLIIYRSHRLLKWSSFFWPTLYNLGDGLTQLIVKILTIKIFT